MSKFLNFQLPQSLIITLASILFFLFVICGQIVSIDKQASYPYLFMGIISSIIIFYNRNKIKLFSPLFIFFVSLFFAIIFSAFYYFAKPIDIMNNPVFLSGTIIDEINILYLIFFFFTILPIIFFSMYNIKLKKYHIPSVNKKNLNLVSLLYEIMIILLLNLFFIISGISPIEAILNPLGFRTAIHSGEIVFLNIFFNFIFYFLSILMFIDTFKKNNLIKPYSKFILLLLLFYYSIACGARGFLVYFIFYLVMSFTFYKKIKIKDCLIGLVILIILSIFNSIYLQYRNIKNDLSKAQVSLTTTQSYSKLSLLEDIAKRNDSFANSIVFFKWYKEKNNDLIINNPNHIMEETTYHCLAYIPRKYKNMIYDNDDQGFLFTIMMTNKLYNNAYYREGISYDIGGIANCYWNFGIIGICIGGFLFGSLICFMQILFDLYYTNEIFIAFYLLIGYPLLDSFFKVGFINAPLTINLIFNILIFYIISILSFKTLKFKY